MSYTQCATNSTTQAKEARRNLPKSLTGKAGDASTSISAPFADVPALPATTGETGDDLPKTIPELRRYIARLRNQTRTDNERIRAAYEAQANEKLKAVVAKERAHMQAQVDAKIAWCDAYAAKCDAQVNHAWQQVEIIEAENAALKAEIERLAAGEMPKKDKGARLKELKRIARVEARKEQGVENGNDSNVI